LGLVFFKEIQLNNKLIENLNKAFAELQYDIKIEEQFYIRPHLLLGNGTAISIQGSNFHYSAPRESLKKFSDYKCLELMIVDFNQSTKYERLIQDGYAEADFLEYRSVCEYVPTDVLLELIADNGGLVAYNHRGNIIKF
jgi:hypothetical protein